MSACSMIMTEEAVYKDFTDAVYPDLDEDKKATLLKINWHFGEENDIMTISNGAVLSAVFV